MPREIKAIETSYKGYRFRSRLEARWAVFFDALGVKYQYEPQGFDLGPEGWYLPDFYLPDLKTWVEIKPGNAPSCLSLYLAGKMNDWRSGIDLRGHYTTGPDETTTWHCRLDWHGADDSYTTSSIVESCRREIQQCDQVVVWVSSLDCYGTLVELGYAAAIGKPILFAVSQETHARLSYKAASEYRDSVCRSDRTPPKHAMWFPEMFCDKSVVCRSPQEAIDVIVPPYTEEEKKCRRLARLKPFDAKHTVLSYGDPWPGEYELVDFSPTGNPRRKHIWTGSGRTEFFAGCRFSDNPKLTRAFQSARSARFEHGETPRP